MDVKTKFSGLKVRDISQEGSLFPGPESKYSITQHDKST